MDASASVITGEMLHFMGVITAAIINYSCALIIELQLTKQKAITHKESSIHETTDYLILI